MAQYTNLPSNTSVITDTNVPQYTNSTLPKALLLGTSTNDQFLDGTPIWFNQPYVVNDLTTTPLLFGQSSGLTTAMNEFVTGNSGTYIPVVVRIGYHPNFSPVVNNGSKQLLVNGDYIGSTNVPIWVNVSAYTAGTTLTVQASQSTTVPTTWTGTGVTTVTGNPLTMEAVLSTFGLTLTLPTTSAANDVYEITVTPRVGTVSQSNSSGATLSVSGSYQGSFNGAITIKTISAPTSATTLAGGIVSVYYGSSTTPAHSSIAMTTTVNGGVPNTGLVLKDLGLTLSFAAGTALNTVGDTWAFVVYAGRNPVNNDETYKALQDAYTTLSDYDAQVVIPYGVRMDDTFTNQFVAVEPGDPDYTASLLPTSLSFAYQLSRYAYTISTSTSACMGFIGTTSPASYGRKDVTTWANSLASNPIHSAGYFATADNTATGTPITDSYGNPVDIGKHLVVIPGDVTIAALSGTRNAAVNTAATLLSLPVGQGAVNTTLNNASVAFNTSLDVANTLAGARMTPLYNKRGTGTVILTGLTAAQSNSAYTKISTMTVVNEILQNIRSTADSYLGKKNSAAMQASLQRALQSQVDAAVQLGYVAQGSAVQVTSVGTDATLGNISVYVKLIPYYEIHSISTNLQFSNSQLQSAQALGATSAASSAVSTI